MIHREGYKSIFIAMLFVVVVGVGFFTLLNGNIYGQIILGLATVVFVIVLQFFRNPGRNTKPDSNAIIAPADGKVVVIEDTQEHEYFKDMRKQISIFMSPINVHVNRSPIAGVVKYQRYYPGKYLVAWHPKSSTENERTTIVVEGSKGPVLFRQIAGALARRIVCYAKEGQKLEQGGEFGFIKFGSRVDIFLPVNCKVKVNLGQKTVGGETVIAHFN